MSTKAHRYVLLGHPVRHSLSPAMFHAAFAADGLPHTYTPIDVPTEDDFCRMVSEIRSGLFQGANVTQPYKRYVLKLLEHIPKNVEEVGAANVITGAPHSLLAGENTDVDALVQEISELTSHRTRAAILGAGGAAHAAVAACKRLDFAVVGVTSRSWVDSLATIDAPSAISMRDMGAITSPWPDAGAVGTQPIPSTKFSMEFRMQFTELCAAADIVIQATTAGMLGGPAGDELVRVVPFAAMPKHAVMLDLIYRPRVTPFVARAEQLGFKVRSGLSMLVRQAEASYRLFTGRVPPEGVMWQTANAALK